MTLDHSIPPELRERIDSISARTGRTPAEIIADALENGHSLAWQERFLDKVAKGIAAADKGEFATDADIGRIRNKYRSS